jgi:hypothetical protein
MLLR